MKLEKLIIYFLLTLSFVLGCDAQSRVNRLTRPCPGTATPAVVEIERDGDVNIAPCPTGDFLVNGSTYSVTGLSSFNGLVGASQTLSAPAAADTAAWSSAGTAHTLQLPITSISGSSRTNYFPYFNAANTFAKSPFSWDGSQYLFNNSALDGEFVFSFRPSTGVMSGQTFIGDTTGEEQTFIYLSNNAAEMTAVYGFMFNAGYQSAAKNVASFTTTSSTIGTDAGMVTTESSGLANIGDVAGYGSGTQLAINDTTRQFSFNGTNVFVDFSQVINFTFQRTVTAAGTTGNQTIHKPVGSVNFAAGATAVTVTNARVSATSLVLLTPQKSDSTCRSFAIDSKGAGVFTITANAACAAETAVAFMVTN